MIQLVIRFDPAAGKVQIGAPPGLPAAQVHLLLDLARQMAAQQALTEFQRDAGGPAVSVPTADQVRALGK